MRAVPADVDVDEKEGPPRNGWAVAVAATLGMSVSYIDRQTLASIAPHVREALDIDHTHYGWLVSAFSMAYLVGAPLAGVLVDRLGARRGFAIAVAVWTCIAGLHAFAASFTSLFVLRLALGVAESPSFPAAAQAIRRALPGARRATAYGFLFTGSSIGGMIVAPAAVALDARFGFRFAFLATAAAGTLWIPFWLFATRGDRGAPPTPSQRSTAPPSRWIDFVTSAPVARAVVAVVGSAPLLMFVLNFTPQYLVERWHLEPGGIGGHLVFPLLVFDGGAIGFGLLASRREPVPGAARRTHTDLMVLAASLGSLLALTPLAATPGVAVALFSFAAAGGGGVYVLATSDMLARVPLARTSSAGGMTAAAQSLSHVVVSPLVGFAIDRTHGYGVVLVLLGLAIVPTSFAFVLWPSIRALESRPVR